MIMNSGRFSGGSSGGGSNRDVVFTARVVADPKNAQVLSGIAKQVDDLQKKLSNIRMGVPGDFGPGMPSGRGGVGVAGGGGSRRQVDPYDEYNRMRDQELREQREYRRRMERDRQRTEARLAAAQFNAIDRENAAFDRRGGRAGMNARMTAMYAERSPNYTITRGQFGEALEGVTSLARAAAFLGASSEESAQKMLKHVLVFEAFAQATRGTMKISEPLGALLGMGGARLGIGAGASAGWLGAAGLAAGVGILGGGAALFDQARYSAGGGVGGFSQMHANFFTGLARRGLNNGIDLSGRFGQIAGTLNPIQGIFNASGYTRAVTDRARGDIAYERGATSRAFDTGNMLEYSTRRLENERQILALMNQQAAKARETLDASISRAQGIANNYQSLSPWDQKRAEQLRDKFVKNPRALNSNQLNALRPILGEAENQQIDQIMLERSSGYLGGGGASREQQAMAPGNAARTILMQTAAGLQRTFVIQLQRDNDEMVKRFSEALGAALEVANDDLAAKLQKEAQRVEESRRNVQQQTQYKLQDIERAYGVP